MTLCGQRPYLNTSEKWTLHQGLNMAHNISEDFPFLNVEDLETHIMGGVIILISVFGLVGNGVVLWFLCFCLKRDSFIFITNLAVADFGVLFAMFIYYSLFFIVYLYGRSHSAVCVTSLCLLFLYVFMLCASALFLAAVSVDRCVAVFFPLWYRCHRPKSLPTIVSTLLWPFTFVVGGLVIYLGLWLEDHIAELTLYFLFDSFMVISILTLFIRVYCYSHPCRRKRLVRVIMLSLFVFIITIVPQNFLLLFITDSKKAYLFKGSLTSLNSSANPVIYFFVGRMRSVPSRRSVKAVLQKVFKEEEDYAGQTSSSKSPVQTTY